MHKYSASQLNGKLSAVKNVVFSFNSSLVYTYPQPHGFYTIQERFKVVTWCCLHLHVTLKRSTVLLTKKTVTLTVRVNKASESSAVVYI